MDRDYLRRKTCLVIRRNGEYLVALSSMVKAPKWSENVYDAWQTRRIEDAQKVASKMGGTIWMFNPVVGQLREANV